MVVGVLRLVATTSFGHRPQRRRRLRPRLRLRRAGRPRIPPQHEAQRQPGDPPGEHSLKDREDSGCLDISVCVCVCECVDVLAASLYITFLGWLVHGFTGLLLIILFTSSFSIHHYHIFHYFHLRFLLVRFT